MLLVASAVLATVLSATDIYDELTGRASTIMAWAEGSAAFITGHTSFLPAGVTNFVNQFAAQTYPVLVFVIALLPGIAAVIVGYAAQTGLQGAVALLRADGVAVRPCARHAAGSPIRSAARASWPGVLEPEVSAHCQAVLYRSRHVGDARERRLGRAPPRPCDRLTRPDRRLETFGTRSCSKSNDSPARVPDRQMTLFVLDEPRSILIGTNAPKTGLGAARRRPGGRMRKTSAVATACRRRCLELRLRSSWRW